MRVALHEFQWAPTLGGECYQVIISTLSLLRSWFQWAPTLGGECYTTTSHNNTIQQRDGFNGHPPLGVNATELRDEAVRWAFTTRFNGHPPLGVNATCSLGRRCVGGTVGFNGHPPLGVNATDPNNPTQKCSAHQFQWAPTLGGECYVSKNDIDRPICLQVSMGTHPWG